MRIRIALASVLSVCCCATSVVNETGDGTGSSAAGSRSAAGGSTTGSCPSATSGSLSCQWPAAADTFDAGTNQGCKPNPGFESCEVPNGSIILADGGVVTPDGGVVTCTDLCCATEYELTCSGAPPREIDGGLVDEDIPTPAPSLNCKAIPIPTPINSSFYCCPCAP